jgi:hypothetical protein
VERERREIVKVEGLGNRTYLGARLQVRLISFRIAERFGDSRNRFSGIGPGDKLGSRGHALEISSGSDTGFW